MSDVTRPGSNGQYGPEPKVIASTIASALTTLFGVGAANGAANMDYGTVTGLDSELLETVLLTLLSAAVTFVAGWFAKHQHRRTGGDLPPTAA